MSLAEDRGSTPLNSMSLQAYQLHPQACRIQKAEKTLCGTAHKEGVKWCHPFSTVNALGWWLYPPSDFDVVWTGEKFGVRFLDEYYNSDEDAHLVRRLVRPEDGVNPDKWCPFGTGRTKMSLGSVEPNVLQLWTGLIFKTPPGWCLHIKSPINYQSQPFHVMDGVLETDWMQYDIWMNLVFDRINEPVSFRRDQSNPIAQLIPMQRETYSSDWKLEVSEANRETQESNEVFEYWMRYNERKFGKPKENSFKDSTTFYMERKRILNNQGLPNAEAKIARCPFSGLHDNPRESDGQNMV